MLYVYDVPFTYTYWMLFLHCLCSQRRFVERWPQKTLGEQWRIGKQMESSIQNGADQSRAERKGHYARMSKNAAFENN